MTQDKNRTVIQMVRILKLQFLRMITGDPRRSKSVAKPSCLSWKIDGGLSSKFSGSPILF